MHVTCSLWGITTRSVDHTCESPTIPLLVPKMSAPALGLARSFKELMDRLEDLLITNKHGEKDPAIKRFRSKVTRRDFPITTTQGPLIVHSWQFPEFELYPDRTDLPCYARGLFTSPYGIVARGYDKFFNVDEYPSLTQLRLKAECTGPFNVSTKENGCILFFAGLQDGTLLVCSKNMTGDYSPSATGSHYMRGYQEIERQLTKIGRTTRDFAQALFAMNATAVAELCDDDFEEHVLEYSGDDAGLYLHGINKNTIELQTACPEQVTEFGTTWGFKNVDQLRFDTFDTLMHHLNEVAKSGIYKGKETEGFVVRCKRQKADFFFKFKFEQPYLLYRQWREVTNRVFSDSYATKTIREVVAQLSKHQRITLAYLLFVKDYFMEHPEAQKQYEEKHGVIKMRKLFLQHLGLGESEGAKALELDTNESLVTKLDNLLQTVKTVYCVVTIAAPGCGKSTVCRTLAGLNPNWVHLENDNFSQGSLFINEILSALDSNQLCFVDRMNYRERYRGELFRRLHENRNRFILPDTEVKFIGINFLGNGVSDNTADILQQRILSRGDCHQTVQALSHPKQAISLMQGVLRGFQAPVCKNDDDDSFRRVVKGDELTKSDSNFAFVINIDVDKMDSSLDNARIVYGELVNAFEELQIKDLSEDSWNQSYKAAREYIPEIRKKVQPEQRKVEYYGIEISKSDITTHLDTLLHNDATWQRLKAQNRVQNEFHVTLAHQSSSKLEANQQEWGELGRLFRKNQARKTAAPQERVSVDILCDINIKRVIVVHDQLITLEVTNEGYSQNIQNKWVKRSESLPHTNKYLHITVGTVSTQIKPMMSNVYLEHVHQKNGANDALISVIKWEQRLEEQKGFIKFF